MRITPGTTVVWILLTLASLAPVPSALGQEQQEEPAPSVPDLTEKEVRERATEIEADPSLEEAVRAEALSQLQAALEALSRVAEATATTAKYLEQIDTAPSRLEDAQLELAEPADEVELEVDSDWTVADVEAGTDKCSGEAAADEAEVERVGAQSQRRSERDGLIEGEKRAARKQLTDAQTELDAPPAQISPLVAEARRMRLRAEMQNARATLDALDAEVRRDAAEERLLPLLLDLARREAVDPARHRQE